MSVIAEITQVCGGFRQSQKIERFDSIGDALAWARMKFDGHYKRERIFVDTKSRGTIQTGWIYRMRGDDHYWVSFSRVISETERTAEAIDIEKETP